MTDEADVYAPPFRLPRRFVTLTDTRGNHQRVMLDEVSRWWPERQGLAVVVGGETVMFSNASAADAALCRAFYEVTPGDLGL